MLEEFLETFDEFVLVERRRRQIGRFYWNFGVFGLQIPLQVDEVLIASFCSVDSEVQLRDYLIIEHFVLDNRGSTDRDDAFPGQVVF